jgi:hypothetical protein
MADNAMLLQTILYHWRQMFFNPPPSQTLTKVFITVFTRSAKTKRPLQCVTQMIKRLLNFLVFLLNLLNIYSSFYWNNFLYT